MSLEISEYEAARVQKPGTDRVTLDYIKSRIGAVVYRQSTINHVVTICEMRVDNGFTVIGMSAPADPENFNAEFGKKLAHDDCIRQLWPLFGFALCEHRHNVAQQMMDAGASTASPLNVEQGHPGEYVRKLQQSQAERVQQQRQDTGGAGEPGDPREGEPRDDN